MRLNFSVFGFLETSCYIIIFGFFWRMLSAKLALDNGDSPTAKAMAVIY